MTYEITWKRSAEKDTPEEVKDVIGRKQAVEDILRENGIDDYEYKRSRLELSGDIGEFYVVCKITLLSVDALLRVYELIEWKESDEVEVTEVLDEYFDK